MVGIAGSLRTAVAARGWLSLFSADRWLYDELREQPQGSVGLVHCPQVESVLGRVSGAEVFPRHGIPAAAVFENLEAGATVQEIMEWFELSREEVTAVVHFAARSLSLPVHS